ncbi:MAG: hypothetical protein RL153_1169 [Verrucomicrobiota bacterium]
MWARNILHAGEVVRACALACLGWACASAWAEGDVAPRHWAFEPLPPSAAPAPASLIDAHHASALRHAGLSASGEASRAAWLRRATFLVTGLPPTAHEVEAFESDARPGAWERVVDRLLASPRHGERWAKAWLDACGYADSNGYFNADSDRPLAHRYRDYVIRSFNASKPFDQFVREQLAGDELSGWRPGRPVTPEVVEWLVATHFLRNGQDGSGESDGNPDEVRVDRYYALESAVQVVGTSLLGLTFQCAKCHDHKFEPLSQREYYGLQAFLYPAFDIGKWTKPNDRVVRAPLPGEHEAWKEREAVLDRELADARAALREWSRGHRPAGRVLFADTFEPAQPLASRWSNTAPGDDAPGGMPAVRVDSEAAPGAFVREGRLHVVEGGGGGDRWICTKASFDWRPARPGAWIQATFDLVADRLSDKETKAERIGYFIAAHDFHDNGPVPGGNILIDGNPGGASVVDVDYPGADMRQAGRIGSTGYQPGRNHGVRVTRRADGKLDLEHLVDGAVDGAALVLQDADLPPGAFGFEYCCGRSFVVDNVVVEASPMGDPAWAGADDAYRKELAGRKAALEVVAKGVEARRTPEPGRIAWTTDSGPEASPVPLLKRGNPKTPGEPVPPRMPAVLARGMQPEPSRTEATTGRRLALANWLFVRGSPQEGLVARVAANRVWQHYFGTGLVSTPENLGVSGARPSNPALVDALAARLASGWDMKGLHRDILLSAAFRQASAPREEGLRIDPSNRLLWRFPLRRLDAESIRDGMLAAAGVLDGKASGPYVPTPRAPDGEVAPDESQPGGLARAIFLQSRRTQVPTFLQTFDAPSIVFTCTRRATTTMPLQSLAQLNSAFCVRRGRDMAAWLKREAPDPARRMEAAFVRAFGRRPTPEERAAAGSFLAGQSALRGDDGAWADLCQSLLASNAFLYLE